MHFRTHNADPHYNILIRTDEDILYIYIKYSQVKSLIL